MEQYLPEDPNITLCLYYIPEQLMQQTLYKKIPLAEKGLKHNFLFITQFIGNGCSNKAK